MLLLVGIAAGLIPGPGGIVFVLFGGALLASELRVVARALDRSEVRLRRLWTHIRRAWRASATWMRITLCCAGAALACLCVLAIRAWYG